MPLYYLYTRQPGTPGWTYSGYQLNVTGGTNNGLNVQARTWSQTPPPNPGTWQAVSGVSTNGNGNPNSPQNGDDLDIPSSIGTVTNLVGAGTYSATGDGTHGAGYYTNQGPEQDEGDWCATGN